MYFSFLIPSYEIVFRQVFTHSKQLWHGVCKFRKKFYVVPKLYFQAGLYTVQAQHIKSVVEQRRKVSREEVRKVTREDMGEVRKVSREDKEDRKKRDRADKDRVSIILCIIVQLYNHTE